MKLRLKRESSAAIDPRVRLIVLICQMVQNRQTLLALHLCKICLEDLLLAKLRPMLVVLAE